MAAAVSVQDRLVAADPEATGALAGGDLLCGAEVGPQPVRGPQDVQGVAVAAYRCGVLAGQPKPIEGGVQQFVGVGAHHPRFDFEASRPADHDQLSPRVALQSLQQGPCRRGVDGWA
ncbi:hypothetical protein ABZ372_00270 [Streptomyces sp. NPDC005921]|uniref:hypothetical protein n=1 Tax=Streptomyces sp. NPDC005827 TaxID=3157070 RepID=UPI0033FA302D